MSFRRVRSSSFQRACNSIVDFRVLMVSVSPVRYPLPVRMAVTLMRSGLADEIKTVAQKCGDEFSGSERPKTTIVEAMI